MYSRQDSFIVRVVNWCQSLLNSLYLLLFSNSISFETSGLTIYYSGSISNIGEGAYSTVFKAKPSLSSKPEYALKRMLLQSDEINRIVTAELAALKTFSHPNIIQLIDSKKVIENYGSVAYLLFPLMPRGSLRDVLLPTTPRDDDKLTSVLEGFLSICEAVNVLHQYNPSYIHQDIKLENVLVGPSGEVYLIDFGSVRRAVVEITSRKEALRIADEAAQNCTASYRPPELYDPPTGIILDTRTDVWSLGCLLFAWWFGYSPFECEFSSNTVKVTECSPLRVLAPIPQPTSPSPGDITTIKLSQWILQKDFTVRPFTSDIIARVRGMLQSLSQSVDNKV